LVGRGLGARHRDLEVLAGYRKPLRLSRESLRGARGRLRLPDEAALFEPVGTVFVGATLGAVLISPLLGAAGGGLIALIIAFALSSIPGAAIGYGVLKVLRRSGQIG
jgi:hypothetical protein